MSKASREGPERPSFAEVAAMRPPSQQHSHLLQHENTRIMPAELVTSPLAAVGASTTHPTQHSLSLGQQDDVLQRQDVDGLSTAVHNLYLTGQKDPEEDSESSGEMQDDAVLKTEGTFEDDQTHLSNSSTKPTSFDSKSMASVTTFAMDEKESLRPDDSASVQAAEEDDSFSGPASGAPNSQVGSEAGGRFFRIPDQIGTSQRIPGILSPGGPRLPDAGFQMGRAFSPNGGSNSLSMAGSESFQSERNLHGFPKDPDEKLLEAMNSQKDRLLLLQLEEKIIAFIKDSNEQSLELPPCNAFGRLLAHKLGDYYHLTHFVDNNVTSVRLHRTPWCRLPTPLSMLQGPSANKTPPPSAPAMKIMRRVGHPGEKASAGGSTAASSSAPSKATSEAGVEGASDEDRNGVSSSAGATSAKDRATLTREEREAKYQEARERIFRDFAESKSSDNTQSGGQGANLSRSNSASGRRKGHKQRTTHDDGFEARSQFNAYYSGVPFPGGQMPFNGGMHDASFASPNFLLGSPPSGLNFPPGNPPNMLYPSQGTMKNIPQYSLSVPPHLSQNNSWQTGHMQPSSPYAGFAPVNQVPPMMSPQSTTRPSPSMNTYVLPSAIQYQQSPSAWAQSPYQTNFPQPPTQRNPPPVHWPNFPTPPMTAGQVSYTYGQAPNQNFVPGMRNNPVQYPLPGNFTRPPFNPQTRSFVPGGGSPRYSAKGQQAPLNPPYSSPQFGNSSPWQTIQDSTNNAISISSNSQMNNKASLAPASSNPSSAHGGPPGNQDSIAKWGTPSHLPPKPPPSEVPYEFDIKTRTSNLPNQPYSNISAHSKTGPLVVSGGTGLQKSHGGVATGL